VPEVVEGHVPEASPGQDRLEVVPEEDLGSPASLPIGRSEMEPTGVGPAH